MEPEDKLLAPIKQRLLTMPTGGPEDVLYQTHGHVRDLAAVPRSGDEATKIRCSVTSTEAAHPKTTEHQLCNLMYNISMVDDQGSDQMPKPKPSDSPVKRLVALKVLVCWMDGKTPSAEDVQQLRSFEPEFSHLPLDELACVVIKKLSVSHF